MTCKEVRQNWMLFVDSEGDPELHLRLSDHLAMCPGCAEWLTRQQRFEQALAERMSEPEDSSIWERVLRFSSVKEPAQRRRRVALRSVLVAAVVVLAGVVIWSTNRQAVSAELPRLTADCHQRHLSGVSQIEFRSQDVGAIDRYITSQVPFRAVCPPRAAVGFVVEGAGVCRWAPEPMVYFVGRVDDTSVSVFVLDRATLDTFPRDRDRLAQGDGRSQAREGGYQTVSALTAENVVVVVGTAPAEVLEKILKAYRDSLAG